MKDEDFKMLRGFDLWQTDERTFVIVELLSRLKIFVKIQEFKTFKNRKVFSALKFFLFPF